MPAPRLPDLAKNAIKGAIRSRLLRLPLVPTVKVGTESEEHVKVIVCLWNRPDRVRQVVEMLGGQTGLAGVDLYLWNNARADHAFYESTVRDLPLDHAVRSVCIFKAPYNLGSIARFYVARQLARRGHTGPVVILDDDEDVRNDFLLRCLTQYAPSAITAWWAFEVGETYFERTPSSVGGHVDHIGPGGMICDASVFSDRRFFTDLPDRYWFLDDLWLSYFAKREGLELRKLDVDIEFVLDETNQYRSLIHLKQEFFEYLYPKP